MPVIVTNNLSRNITIVSIFIILFILVIGLVFSIYLNQNYEGEINITKAQFDLLTNKAKLPEGVLNSNSILTKDTRVDPRNFTFGDLEDNLAGLAECPENECAVDVSTGVKRCPENSNTRIVYNPVYEVCSQKFFCTSDRLPYAILSSGETDNFGVCEPQTACRCTEKVVCPKYVTSSIRLNSGTSYSSKSYELNYYFTKKDLDPNKVSGYDSIEILGSMQSREFCQINPAYTDRIVGGCNFTNSDSDILGCQDSEDFISVSEDSFIENYGGENLTLNYQNNPEKNFETVKDQLELLIKGENKPPKGFMLKKTEDSIKMFDYTENSVSFVTLGGENSSVLKNISTVEISEVGETKTTLGFQDEGLTNGEAGDYTFRNVIYTGCRAVDRNTTSDKNMLICLQESNKICTVGQLSYNVDDKPPLDFCQINFDLENYLTNQDDDEKYKKDPVSYTLSCTLGGGCSADYNSSRCLPDGNCDDVIEEYKTKFFERYDASAVKNFWFLKRRDFSINPYVPGEITFIKDEHNGLEFFNDGLMEIEPGDYFSTFLNKFSRINLQDVEDIVQGENKTFILNTVEDIFVDQDIYYNGFRGQVIGKSPPDSEVTVNVLSSSITSIPKYAVLEIYKDIPPSDDGRGFGKFWKDKSGKVFVSQLAISTKEFPEDSQNLFLFKQFGFNGPNYNSFLEKKFVDGEIVLKRKYSESSKWAYWIKENKEELLTPPLASPVIPLREKLSDLAVEDIQKIKNSVSFSFNDADFKKQLSFYYPVWNSEVNNQVCVRCRPYLQIYPKLSGGETGKITNAVIQFSGKDFGQYCFYPVLDEKNNDSPRFVFNFFTKLNVKKSTTKRLFFDTPNPNIPVRDEIFYRENPYYILDSYNVLEKKLVELSPPEKIPESRIRVGLISQSSLVKENYLQTNMVEEKDDIFVFEERPLPPMENVEFYFDEAKNYYTNDYVGKNLNYFSGKEYIFVKDENIHKYSIYGRIRIKRVDIVEGNMIVTTNSSRVRNFISETGEENPDIVFQIVSEKDSLDLKIGSEKADFLKVSGITDKRVTDIKVEENKTENSLPGIGIISVERYRDLL